MTMKFDETVAAVMILLYHTANIELTKYYMQ
jgi:hypothetical protein